MMALFLHLRLVPKAPVNMRKISSLLVSMQVLVNYQDVKITGIKRQYQNSIDQNTIQISLPHAIKPQTQKSVAFQPMCFIFDIFRSHT